MMPLDAILSASALAPMALAALAAIAIIGLRFWRRGAARFWAGPGALALALLPAAAGALVSAVALRNVAGSVTLAGSGGIAALAAGAVESLAPALIGLAATVPLLVLAFLVVAAGSQRAEGATTDSGALAIGTSLLAFLAGPVGVVAVLGLAHALSTRIGEASLASLPWLAPIVVSGLGLVVLLGVTGATIVLAPRTPAPLGVKVGTLGLVFLSGVVAIGLGAGTLALGARLTVAALTGRAQGAPPVVPPLDAPSPVETETPPDQSLGESPAAQDAEEPTAPAAAPSRRPRTSDSPGVPPPPPRPSAIRVGGTVPEPRKIRNVSPVYPEIAKQAKVQGVVILECTIGADGRVSDVRVLRGIPLLDQAAVEAVRQWQYAPTELNGVAVPVIMTVTVNFKLR